MQKDSGKKPARKGRVRRWTRKDGTEVVKDYGPWVAKLKPQVFGNTVADLVDRFESSRESKRQNPRNKEKYSLAFRRLRESIGKVPLSKVKRINLIETRDAIAERYGDGAAFNWAANVSKLFRFAQKNGLIGINPAVELKEGMKLGELKPWTRDEIELALDKLPETLRRVILLGINTGQRKGDLVAARWSQYDGKCLYVKQEKTDQPLRIPLSPAFRAELDKWRSERIKANGANVLRLSIANERILLNAHGRPWDGRTLWTVMSRTLIKIDGFPTKLNRAGTCLIPARSLHGLRYYLCAALAQAGCTPHQIMAISGHKTLSMVQKYCKMYDRADSGELALAKLLAMQDAQENARL